MPFLYVNRAEIGRHDTKAAVGRAITDAHDTRAVVSNIVVDLLDTRVAVSNQRTNSFDTRAVVSNIVVDLFDTRAAVSNASLVGNHDTRAAVNNTGLVGSHDTRAAVSNQRTNSFDTRAVVSNVIVDLFDARSAISNILADYFDTRAAVGNIVVDLFDTRAIINPPASFVHAAGGVYFPRAPKRPYRKGVQLHQVREYASGEEVYVYSKGSAGRIIHHLVFAHIDGGTLAALLTFAQSTVKGVQKTFTWKDHDQASRTVRLAEPRVDYRQTGKGRHTVEIILEEQL